MKVLSIARVSLIILSCLAISGAVYALPINQEVIDNYGQIHFFGPVGQSFIAEDNHVVANLWTTEYNQHSAPSDYDITYYLYEGNGAGGTLLDSGIFSGLIDGYWGWAEFDLYDSSLTIGNIY